MTGISTNGKKYTDLGFNWHWATKIWYTTYSAIATIIIGTITIIKPNLWLLLLGWTLGAGIHSTFGSYKRKN